MNVRNIIYVPELSSRMDYPVGTYIRENIQQIKVMAHVIKKHFKGHVRLICRGSSGAIIAGIISSILDKCEVVYYKKPGEVRHGSTSTRWIMEGVVYNVIVDDFVSTGETVRELHKQARYDGMEIHGLVVSGHVSPTNIENLCIHTLISGTHPPDEISNIRMIKPDPLNFTLA